MAEAITIQGTLQAGPAGTSGSSFPAGSTTIPFDVSPSPKPYSCDTGKNVFNINSPNAYVALGGIGPLGPVTQVHTLHFRSQVPMLLRLTVVNPAGGTIVIAGIPVQGLFVMEFASNQSLTLLEVQGSGQVEFYAAGLV